MARNDPGTTTVALSLAVDLAARVIERRNTIPILSNVLLVSDGKTLTVSGCDLDIEISVAVASKAPAFSTTVEADPFRRIAATSIIDDDLHTDGAKLVIGKGPTFMLRTLPAEDYCHVEAKDFTTSFELPASQLLADLDAVSPAIGTEETRYLTGVCLHTKDGKLRLATTDGHRLHLIERDAPEGVTLSKSIIPRKCVKLLRAVLETVPVATVRLEFVGKKVRFSLGPVTITSKLIDGTYPDYNRVVPTAEAKGTLTVKASALLKCVRAAENILTGNSTAVVLDFKGGVVRAKDVGTGEMTADMPGELAGGPLDAIAFNTKYLGAICERFGGGDMIMSFTDPSSPTLMTGPDSRLTTVLMPVRV